MKIVAFGIYFSVHVCDSESNFCKNHQANTDNKFGNTPGCTRSNQVGHHYSFCPIIFHSGDCSCYFAVHSTVCVHLLLLPCTTLAREQWINVGFTDRRHLHSIRLFVPGFEVATIFRHATNEVVHYYTLRDSAACRGACNSGSLCNVVLSLVLSMLYSNLGSILTSCTSYIFSQYGEALFLYAAQTIYSSFILRSLVRTVIRKPSWTSFIMQPIIQQVAMMMPWMSLCCIPITSYWCRMVPPSPPAA